MKNVNLQNHSFNMDDLKCINEFCFLKNLCKRYTTASMYEDHQYGDFEPIKIRRNSIYLICSHYIFDSDRDKDIIEMYNPSKFKYKYGRRQSI